MKFKTIAAAAILSITVSSPAFAYCDGRGDRCWKMQAESSMAGIQKTYNILMNSQASDEYKNSITNWVRDTDNRIQQHCNTWKCVAKSKFDMSMTLHREYAKVRKELGLPKAY